MQGIPNKIHAYISMYMIQTSLVSQDNSYHNAHLTLLIWLHVQSSFYRLALHASFLLFRLLTLVCPETFIIKITMFPKGGKFQSSGQLQRPFTIASTPLPVMFGAMAAFSMRYGLLAVNHLANPIMLRWNYLHCMHDLLTVTIMIVSSHIALFILGYKTNCFWISSPTSTWMPEDDLQYHDKMLVSTYPNGVHNPCRLAIIITYIAMAEEWILLMTRIHVHRVPAQAPRVRNCLNSSSASFTRDIHLYHR